MFFFLRQPRQAAHSRRTRGKGASRRQAGDEKVKKRGKQAAGRVEAEREKQVTAQSVQLRVLEHDAVRFEQVLVQDGE